jgi:hypothetical protein
MDHAGKISAEVAKSKAEQEYGQYHSFLDPQPRKVDLDFEQEVKQLPKAAHSTKLAKPPKPPTGWRRASHSTRESIKDHGTTEPPQTLA